MLIIRRLFLQMFQELLELFDLRLVATHDLEDLAKKLDKRRREVVPQADLSVAHEFVSRFPEGFLAEYLPSSKAQLHQDLFVLSELDFLRNGYFVEFGATDGKTLSNTYLLEKRFAWTGILAEPARCWHKALRRNRKSLLDTRCVWSTSGKRLLFNETEIGELSTIDSFSSSDGHKAGREIGIRYEVETTSLLDLLDYHCAPRLIDYLSVDTEGSELDILSTFDFDKYSFRVISVEHNFTESRERIRALLEKNGYVRVHEWLSRWDDWYVQRP